jgi:SAM-dependent methyltransferase
MSTPRAPSESSPAQLEQRNFEYWNGPGGQRWVSQHTVIDRAFAAFGSMALARLAAQPGEAIIDVGCGAGLSSLSIARQVGVNGRVLGVDISGPLLAQARALSGALPQVSFVQADAAQHVFEQRFDAAFSRFGVMFFSDSVRAFAQLRQALAPSGRFVFACWQALADNPFVMLPWSAASQLLPGVELPGEEDLPGPFRFASAGRIGGVLSQAGYTRVQIEPARAPVVLSLDGVDAAVDAACQVGPLARALAEQSEAVCAAVREQLRITLAPRKAADGRIELEGAIWLVEAHV